MQIRFLDKVRRQNPLVHNITNGVAMNFTANGLLALGASPIMADEVCWRRGRRPTRAGFR